MGSQWRGHCRCFVVPSCCPKRRPGVKGDSILLGALVAASKLTIGENMKYSNNEWNIYQERAFIENLLCQRFNFFILLFSLIITSAATVKSDDMLLFDMIVVSGILLCSCVGITIIRIYSKLDVILKMIYKYESPAMFKEIQNEANKYKFSFVNVNILIGFYIPVICVLILIALLILMNVC